MKDYGIEDPTCSLAAAEKADLQEALLRGELSREEYNDLVIKILEDNEK